MTSSKNKYIALLRAINVGGNTIIKMDDLRKAVGGPGFSDVSTYIQTGNVLFTSKETDTKKLASQLQKKLKASLGYGGAIFVLTHEKLKKAAAKNPFEPERLAKEQRSHLMFLSGKPGAAQQKVLMAMQGKEYRFSIKDDVFYFAYSLANAGPGRRNINFEKVLGVTGTARSWTVVNKLIELTQEME